MKPKDFLKRYGISGSYRTLNGPRLYIESARGVRACYKKGFVQRCYIDLNTFEAHSVTTGPDEKKCAEINERAMKPLTVLARLARLAKVKP